MKIQNKIVGIIIGIVVALVAIVIIFSINKKDPLKRNKESTQSIESEFSNTDIIGATEENSKQKNDSDIKADSITNDNISNDNIPNNSELSDISNEGVPNRSQMQLDEAPITNTTEKKRIPDSETEDFNDDVIYDTPFVPVE